MCASVLLTDLYELTMLESYFAQRMNGAAVFELFVRKLPAHRNFLVAAGLQHGLCAQDVDQPGALRQELGLEKAVVQATGSEQYIETVWGRGYVMRGPEAATPELERA